MILTTAAILKIVVLILTIAVGYFIFRARLQRNSLILLSVLPIVFAALVSMFVTRMPPLRDTVILTALGENQLHTNSGEIYLSGCTIDGEPFTAAEALKIRNGKWSIKDNDNSIYCWRAETDNRQPEGVTRTIELGVPVGWNRTLVFQGNKWKGAVEVTAGNKTWTVDTYSDGSNWTEITTEIGRSETASLIWNQVYLLAVYTAILVGLTIAVWVIAAVVKGIVKIRLTLSTYSIDVSLYLLLAVFMLIAMRFYHQFNDMFWGDDFINVNMIAYESIEETIERNLQLRDITPPLFNLIAFYVARLLPHTFEALLLIPQFFLFVSVVTMGLVGRNLFGRWGGFLSAVLTATSASLILTTGYEFRGYSMYFMFSALTFLTFICTFNTEFSLARMVALAVCFAGVLYSHYFGVMIVGMYFLADLWRWIHKKGDIKYLGAYVIAGGSFLIWILLLLNSEHNFSFSYPQAPNITDLLDTLSFFLSGDKMLELIFIVACVWLAVNWRLIWRKMEVDYKSYLLLFSVLTILLNIMTVYILGQYKSIYRNRYFVALLPFCFFILLWALDYIVTFFREKFSKMKTSQMIAIGISVFLICGLKMNSTILHDMGVQDSKMVVEQNNQRMLYLDVLAELESKEDISYRTTGVYFNWNTDAYKFLFAGDGFEDVNIENFNDIDSFDKYDTIYYAYYHWESTNYLERYDVINNEFEVADVDTHLKIAKYIRNTNNQ